LDRAEYPDLEPVYPLHAATIELDVSAAYLELAVSHKAKVSDRL
jgi:hypothetical protein